MLTTDTSIKWPSALCLLWMGINFWHHRTKREYRKKLCTKPKTTKKYTITEGTLWFFLSVVLCGFVHAQSPIRDLGYRLAICLKLPHGPYFMSANSKGSGETALMRRLAWAFAGLLCDKYPFYVLLKFKLPQDRPAPWFSCTLSPQSEVLVLCLHLAYS